ncbi:MAG TPA: hypothetical protein VFO85_01600, partial [Vicinamibacteria bacterium]|nr:hypothetical protein [Vicinamibacteria bacterium]
GPEQTLAETERPPGRITWSPDGRSLALALADATGEPAVVSVPAAGGRVRPLVARATAPLWLADGRLVFVRETRSGTFDLWSVRVNDAAAVPGSERRLTDLGAGRTADRVRGASTDGRHLFFRILSAASEDVWLAEAP